MTAVPHTDLAPFFVGFPVVIKTTPVIEAGASITSLAGVPLDAGLRKGAAVIDGSATLTGEDVEITFSPIGLTVGHWKGYLATPQGPIATFAFLVEDPF